MRISGKKLCGGTAMPDHRDIPDLEELFHLPENKGRCAGSL
jgi:hypothetical protein